MFMIYFRVSIICHFDSDSSMFRFLISNSIAEYNYAVKVKSMHIINSYNCRNSRDITVFLLNKHDCILRTNAHTQ